MAIHTFDYTDCPLEPNAAFPHGHVAKRPLLGITLINGTSQLRCVGIVDSGADFVMFPRPFLEVLGLVSGDGRSAPAFGIGSALETVFHRVTLAIEGVAQFEIDAGFDNNVGWGADIGVLGECGFFDHLDVKLCHRLGIFTIET